MALRVGILCNSTTFRKWEADAISHLMAVPGVQVVLLVEHAQTSLPKVRAGGFFQRLLTYPWRLVLYLNYRRRFFHPPAMSLVDMAQTLASVPRLVCTVDQKGASQYFRPTDLEAIRRYAPDVLLRFGFNIIRGDVLALPRFGVWSFHHGDELKYRGGPPGLWEIMNGDPVCGAILQRLTDKLDGGSVLRKGWFKTIDHSLQETVDTLLSASAVWPAIVCKQILAGDHTAAEGVPSGTSAPLYKYPRNVVFLRFIWKLMANKWRFHRAAQQDHEQWNIAVLNQPIHSLLEDDPSLNARWLPEPAKGQFRADPFGYVRNGELNVLYEKYDYANGVGEISRVRPKADNVLKRSRTLLARAEHLSYPYVVQIDEVVYCIPECAAIGRVDLYQLSEDNDSLVFVSTLLNEPLVDPTLFQHGGLWWLFGTKPPLTNVELHAYWSREMTGPFVPHLMDPIKHDIRGARPAGTPFTYNGELWRPAQDSSHTYGGAVVFQRVVQLTPTTFHEVVGKRLGPFKGTPFNKGIHTVSAVGNSTLVDGKRFINVPAQSKRDRQRKWARFKRRKD